MSALVTIYKGQYPGQKKKNTSSPCYGERLFQFSTNNVQCTIIHIGSHKKIYGLINTLIRMERKYKIKYRFDQGKLLKLLLPLFIFVQTSSR